MCRLFLQVSQNNESAASYLVSQQNSLLRQSINDVSSRPNSDGWGICWINGNKKIEIAKSPQSAFLDPEFKNTCRQIKANIILAHIRRGSIGEVSFNNTHPFVYNDWAFVHNGHIPFFKDRAPALIEQLAPEFRKKISGTTDSELFFYMLLSEIKGFSFNDVTQIKNKLFEVTDRLKDKMGTVNNKKALNFILIRPEFQIGYRFNRHMYFCKENSKIIVASEPINDYNLWKEIAEDTFFYIRDGELVHFPA